MIKLGQIFEIINTKTGIKIKVFIVCVSPCKYLIISDEYNRCFDETFVSYEMVDRQIPFDVVEEFLYNMSYSIVESSLKIKTYHTF